MNFRIRLAGWTVEVRPLFDEVRTLCGRYLAPADDARAPDITVTVTPEDIEREREAVLREDRKTGRATPVSPALLETTAVYRAVAAAAAPLGGFVMHGTVLATEGQGVMITAASGTGKTTRASLWVDHIPHTMIVNGDKPLLREAEGAFRAWGTPWCGKEGWNTDTSAPLRAILLLERAGEGEADSVRPASFAELFPRLLAQTHLPEALENRQQTLRLLRSLAGRVRVYVFRSHPTEEAVRLAWETVRRQAEKA